MTRFNPGPGWGTPRPPQPAQQGIIDRPAFWLTMAVTALLAASCGAAMAGSDKSSSDLAATSAQPAATVTATVTASPAADAKAARPQVTVTKRVEVTVTKTVTKQAPAPADNDSDSDSGSGSVYYENCAAARAAGAAPVHRGEPGYGPHLDRDNDGTGCDWG